MSMPELIFWARVRCSLAILLLLLLLSAFGLDSTPTTFLCGVRGSNANTTENVIGQDKKDNESLARTRSLTLCLGPLNYVSR